MFEAINGILLDMLVAVARKDYYERRRRRDDGTESILIALVSRIYHNRRAHMRWVLAAACAGAISLAYVPGADAKGCIKGAVVGGVAGHMAGHGKLGAAAGCAVGHHEANKKDDANKANAQAPSAPK